jgi:hypothetical protein
MAKRRRRRVLKKVKALGRFISREAHELDRLTRSLNTRWIGPRAPLGDAVAEIIEANRPVSYPGVSGRAGTLFEALAAGCTFHFEMHVLPAAPTAPAAWREHGVAMIFPSPTAPRDSAEHERGYAVQELDRFFRTSTRARLRRCRQCGQWFVDTTRNQSGRCCSRPCGIKWSNAQRKDNA